MIDREKDISLSTQFRANCQVPRKGCQESTSKYLTMFQTQPGLSGSVSRGECNLSGRERQRVDALGNARASQNPGEPGFGRDQEKVRLNIVAAEFAPTAGGMEQHAFNLAQSMAAHCDVTVFTSTEHQGVKYDESAYRVCPCLVLDVRSDVETLKNFARPDVWLVLNAGYAPLASELAEPVIVYCHGNDFLNPWIATKQGGLARVSQLMRCMPVLWRYASSMQSLVCRKRVGQGLFDAAGIYVNSSFTRNLLKSKYGSIDTPIRVHTPGIASHFFLAETVRDAYVPGRELQLLTVARLSSAARKKNIDSLIRAVAIVAKKLPVRLRIVGDGNLADDLKMLTSELGLQDAVSFLGALTGPEIRAELERTDLFVLASKASKTDVESFGIVYVEAAAAGVPSLISRSGGAIDAVVDGVSGIVIDHSTDNAIAEGIDQFVLSCDDFDRKRVREFAQSFTWSQIAKRMLVDIGIDSGLHAERC